MTSIFDSGVAASEGTVKAFLRNSPLIPMQTEAPRIIYVRGSDGDDTNDGTAYTAAAALKTIRAAVKLAQRLHYDYDSWVEIRVEPTASGGTYSENLVVNALIDPGIAGFIRLAPFGYTTDYGFYTPTVTLAGQAGIDAIIAQAGVYLEVFGFKISSVGSNCIRSSQGAYIGVVACNFAAATSGAHMHAENFGIIDIYTDYLISAGAQYHMHARAGGIIYQEASGTLSGTPAFSVAFAQADNRGLLQKLGGIINTAGGGASFYPGNIAGTVSDAASFKF